ncbi:hypothetical protein BC835DRAFT_1305112 [Cytidiella melzeri]|nr:hypothetical protein BC835DRAFT_1305112 [Cytidiella melzeri]
MFFFFMPFKFLLALLALAGLSSAFPVLIGHRGLGESKLSTTGQAPGACNITSSESSSVVAVSAERFKPDHCNKTVKITGLDSIKTAHATVVGVCGGSCQKDDLEVSSMVFTKLEGINGQSSRV